ncbi:unnamed protein product [Caenorhabditis auriculariae]|uniref:Uncharacterized protein n=1 Tax=Caenorhabditis auriculariae TaxID=2777116 RepID=A0A8S1HMI4_9PELO|nr:unnamed protein product [Caenorhabditis auriculariae]
MSSSTLSWKFMASAYSLAIKDMAKDLESNLAGEYSLLNLEKGLEQTIGSRSSRYELTLSCPARKITKIYSNVQLPAITSITNLYRLMREDIPERDEFSTSFDIVAIGTTPYIDALATEIPDKFQALFVYDKTATPETVKTLASKAQIPVIHLLTTSKSTALVDDFSKHVEQAARDETETSLHEDHAKLIRRAFKNLTKPISGVRCNVHLPKVSRFASGRRTLLRL